jgi:hypothetical protein
MENPYTDTHSAIIMLLKLSGDFPVFQKRPYPNYARILRKKRPIQYHCPVVKPVALPSENFGRQNAQKHILEYTPCNKFKVGKDNFKITVFWDVTLNTSSRFFRNLGTYLPKYME